MSIGSRTAALATLALSALCADGAESPGPCTRRTGLVISEIMYRPADTNLEYIEVYNAEPIAEDLGGYSLAGAVSYTFPSNTLLPGTSFVVVAKNPTAVQSSYGLANVKGSFLGSLPDGGGTVKLLNRIGSELLAIEYDDDPPWPPAPDGGGHSLAMANPSLGEADPLAWSASSFAGGSPGAWEPAVTDAWRDVVINEFLAHTDPPQEDFIELFNRGTQAVELAGCRLSDASLTNAFVFPTNTLLPAGGFLALRSNTLGFALSYAGETIFLHSPGGGRVIDAIRFGAQQNGVASGRTPDGAPGHHELAAPTEGSNNAPFLARDVVINEIHFNPLGGDSDDEFIELHNRGASPQDVSRWRLQGGVSLDIPTGTVINAGSFLVLARDAARLRAAHTNLTAANTVGDYAGSLSDRGERLVLAKPDDPLLPDQDFVVVDEVTYSDGWGRWADGGGSSLELIDPRADNRLGANWAGSDESAKAPWTTLEATSWIDHGATSHDEVHLLLMGGGEAAVDDVEVALTGGSNVVINAGFEGGLTNWVIQGNHIRSSLTTQDVFAGSAALILRATDGGDNGANRVETDFTAPLPTSGTSVTMRIRGRWRAGSPWLMARTHGNYAEVVGPLATPSNPGTPGAANSRRVANAGPAIHEVAHAPLLPAAGQPVTAACRASDPDGIASLVVHYRVDPSNTFATVAMTQGVGGRFTATLPGASAGTLYACHLVAIDGAGATSRYPAAYPATEALVRFGEPSPPGRFGAYHFWMTRTNLVVWQAREKLSNEPLDATFVYGSNRVIHGAGLRYRGSPFIRPSYNTPTGNVCAYSLEVPPSDRFLGVKEVNLDHLEPGRDNTHIRERLAYWLTAQTGQPASYQRYALIYLNGLKRGDVYADSQQVNSDYFESHFPDDEDGDQYKVDDWFELNDAVAREFYADAQLRSYTTTGGVKKVQRYRWSWEKKSNDGFDDDYTRLFHLVDALELPTNTPAYLPQLGAQADVDQWLGIMALRHAAGDWDGYTYDRGKNMTLYGAAGGPFRLLLWDMDFCLGGGSRDPTGSLYSVNDPSLARLVNHAPAKREYLRALRRVAEGPMNAARFDPVADRFHQALTGNLISAASPAAVKSWVASRRSFMLAELTNYPAAFAVSTSNGADFATGEGSVLLAGTAPAEVKFIRINGVLQDVTWTDITAWQSRIVLPAGTNALLIEAVDETGNVLASFTRTITSLAPAASPLNHLVIHELQHHPPQPEAEFIEIYNDSTNVWFDLAGYRLQGLDFTFPDASLIGPTGFLVVARNAAAYATVYSNAQALAGVYGGALNNAGDTVRLLRPLGTNGHFDVVSEVVFDDAAPWPTNAAGGSASLQLLDPAQDNNRLANWAAAAPTPGAANATNAVLPPLPRLWINEVQPVNTNTVRDRFNEAEPWVELLPAGNVLAVEVHQAAPDDEDCVFQLDLDGFAGATTQSVALVARGAVWRYLDTGSDPGTNFAQPAFDDAAWAAGPAQLGYGDGDEATVVGYGGVPTNKFITTYFRRAFHVSNPSSLASVTMGVQRDDGVRVFLNGSEIMRDNLPTGLVTYTTLAINSIGGSAESTFIVTSVPPALLVAGTNVLAAEIHQEFPGSSDISFDLWMTGRVAGTWRYLDDGSDAGEAWRFPEFDDSGWAVGAPPFGYGNGGEATLLGAGSDPTNRPITTYFRRAFGMPAAGLASNPVLRLVCDDGAVVYLNGREVLRTNMPAGYIAGDTRALQPRSGSEETNVILHAVPRRFFTPAVTNLAPFHLGDSLTNLLAWSFPTPATSAVGQFSLVWADGEPGENTTSEWHTSFRLAPTGGLLAVCWSNDGRVLVLDHVRYPGQLAGRSSGDYPDGAWTNRLAFVRPTPRAPNDPAGAPYAVRINEWMSDNAGFTNDPADGDSDDWIELHNPGNSVIDLSGFTLTDDLASPAKWAFPTNTVMAAGSFLVVWADSETWQTGVSNSGPHAGFRLSSGGEAIGLFTPEGDLVDALLFAGQAGNESHGRWPDGDGAIFRMTLPTPGAPNIVSTNNSPPVITTTGPFFLNESSTNVFLISAVDTDAPPQSLVFSLINGPTDTVLSVTGLVAWLPPEAVGPSTNEWLVRVTDDGFPHLSSTGAILVVVREVNRTPVLTLPPPRLTWPGSLLEHHLFAADPDIPPNDIVFSLVSGIPAGAELSPAGVFTWQPSDAQAGATNLVGFQAVDDGDPAKSVTGLLHIAVAPSGELFRATALSPTALQWSAQSGLLYRVARKDALEDPAWLPFTNLVATGSVLSVSDPGATNAQRFYRVTTE